MQDFKKAIFSSMAFLMAVFLISIAMIEPFMQSEYCYYNDKKLRSSLSGTIDYITLGASHGLCAFVPSIIDEKMNCNAYNLSGSLMAWSGKEELLNQELARNPVQTVVLEIAYNSLTRDHSGDAEGDLYLLPRLDTFPQRADYFMRNVSLSEYDVIYSNLLLCGFSFYKDCFFDYVTRLRNPNFMGSSIHSVPYDNKGFWSMDGKDVSLSKEDVQESYGMNEVSIEYLQDNLESFQNLIDSCQKHNIRVIVCVVPIADSVIWKSKGLDNFQRELEKLCSEYHCECYDFNLLKERYQLFSDENSFKDSHHMSLQGAEIFTECYCDIMKKVDMGEDITDLFYRNYSEMIEDSPYMEYYLSCQ